VEKGWHGEFPSFKNKGIAQASLLHEVEKVPEGADEVMAAQLGI
jgi:hypothetical protein